MMPNRLHILCEVEWPPMGVGWPSENTTILKIVEAVYTEVTGEPGHPDQYPYIDSWRGLAHDPPTCWIMTRLPPSTPPGPEAALMPNPGPGEVLPGASTGHPTHDKVMWKRTVKQGFRTRGAP